MTKLIYIRGLNQSEAGNSGTTIRRGFRLGGTTAATLTTALAGANNDLKFTAKTGGTGGNSITINYTDPGGASATLGVVRTGNAIVVNLGRAASAINSTATAVKAAIDATTAATATVTLTSDTVNVSVDDTVTLGAVTYTFKAAPTTVANQVKIGADAATSLGNLKKAINLTGVSGTDYGSATVIHPTITAGTLTATTLVLSAKTAGTAGNSLASTEASTHLSFGAVTLTGGTDAASALVTVANAPGNSGAGLVTALATTNLAGGGAAGNAMVNNLSTIQVDVDDAATRKFLGRYLNEWVTVPDGGNTIYIRSLASSSVQDSASLVSRGFRITNSAGVPKDIVPGAAAVLVDLDDPLVRKALKAHYSRWIVANTSDSLVTIRGLSTSNAAGYTLTRGFRIKNSGGTQVKVTPGADVTVNVSDAYVRRILRRNIGRYVVVSSP